MTLYDALYMCAMENVYTHFEKPYKAQLFVLHAAGSNQIIPRAVRTAL